MSIHSLEHKDQVNGKTAAEGAGNGQRLGALPAGKKAFASRSRTKKHERVSVWIENLVIPTYLPAGPDKNPMFLEKRVYQGSSGAVYPLPFYDRVATEPVPHSWQALHIENEFVRVMVLPQI